MTINPSALKNIIPPGSRVLCAVSGGADSMCMLHLLNSSRDILNINIAAAHFEHGIRGDESLRDASFVQDYCASNGIEFIMEHGNVPEYASANSLGTEEAARTLRYDFLNRAASQLNCSLIATAHNADDNAETVLFNLSRGGGNSGLSGIPPKRGNVIRPLLSFSRKEIEEYNAANNVPHIEDSTNLNNDYTRNIIRHKVIPVLKDINPALCRNVFHTSELLRSDEDFISSVVSQFINANYNPIDKSLPAEALSAQHKAVASRAIRAIIGKNLSYEHVNAVLDLCSAEGLAYADIPGMRVRKERGRIYFDNYTGSAISPFEIIPGNTYTIPEAGILVSTEICILSESVHGLFNTFYIKYDEIHGALFLSSRRAGDKLRLYGRKCTKTLKQLFLEAGYTQRERDLTPVLRDDIGPLAVPGLALAERAKASRGDRTVKITITKLNSEE